MRDGGVVIGAGQAAAQLAASLRQGGFAAPIVVIGDEPYPPYQRPPLSKKFLIDRPAPDSLYLRAPSVWDEHQVTHEHFLHDGLLFGEPRACAHAAKAALLPRSSAKPTLRRPYVREAGCLCPRFSFSAQGDEAPGGARGLRGAVSRALRSAPPRASEEQPRRVRSHSPEARGPNDAGPSASRRFIKQVVY